MFRFRDRWQTSLGELFRVRNEPTSTERLLALLEDRDRDLEGYLNGAVEWTEPALLNGWSIYAPTSHEIPGFTRIGARVFVRGMVSGGTSGSPVFRLPAGFRPPRIQVRSSISDPNVFARLDVEADGDVIVYLLGAGTNAWASIDCSFSVTP